MSTRSPATISLAADSNNSRRDTRVVERDVGLTLKVTTVSFTSTGTIADSGSGMAFSAGDVIEVRGSPLNSRRYAVTAASAGSLTVAPGVVSSESSGAAITLWRPE